MTTTAADFKRDPLRDELRALYAEVDALLSPFSCGSTTECCDFGLTGREPYPTAIELAEIELAMRASPQKKRLPMAATSSQKGKCPLLSAEGRCRIYASRPFGCRTFFCERITPDGAKLPRKEIQRLSRAVADLSARFGAANARDPGPRPLTRALK